MIIDIEEIAAYAKCPMLYDLKYNRPEIKEKYIDISDKYEKDLRKAVYSFFSKVQDYDDSSLQNLKRVWGRLWIKEKRVTDIVYSDSASWRDSINERRKKGIKSLIGFYNNFKDNPGYPIAVNQPYKITINKNITLTGRFDIIREIDNVIEIMNFKTEDKISNNICIEKNLELTAMSYAFRKLFEEDEDRLIYYGFNKSKSYKTSRSIKDFEILENTVTSISKAIHNKLFYAYPDNKCFGCAYKKICLKELR